MAFAAVVGLTWGLSKRVVPHVLEYFSRQELQRDVYLLAIISLCMSIAMLTNAFGMSLEMGAFCAGLMVRLWACARLSVYASVTTMIDVPLPLRR